MRIVCEILYGNEIWYYITLSTNPIKRIFCENSISYDKVIIFSYEFYGFTWLLFFSRDSYVWISSLNLSKDIFSSQ
jgi:hypothetical protein